MSPDAEADDGDHRRRADHRRVAEDRLAGEDRDDLRETREGRNNQDVDLRVTEDPEEVLPENGGAARLRVEKTPAEITIDQQHDLRRRKRRQREENHEVRHDHHPNKERHAHQRHTFAAHR